MTEDEKKGVAKKPIEENNNTEQSKANPVETERHNSPGELWEEMKNFKEHFKWPILSINIILGLFPVVLDIGTDFNFAHNLNMEGEANQSTT